MRRAASPRCTLTRCHDHLLTLPLNPILPLPPSLPCSDVAALNAASGSTMLASADSKQQKVDKEAMSALSMTSGNNRKHILPAGLREKYEFSKTKSQLSAGPVSPDQAALHATVPTGSSQQLSQSPQPASPAAAAKADGVLLASAPENMNTKQLIKQAAMRQMAVLKAKALIAKPPAAALSAAPVQPARTQQMYNTGFQAQPMMYQSPQPYGYAAPASPYPTQYATYATPQQQLYGQQPNVQYAPARLAGYQAPATSRAPEYNMLPQYGEHQPVAYGQQPQAYQQQQPQQQQLSQAAAIPKPFRASAPAMTPEQVGLAAAKNAAPDWRSPDATVKSKGGNKSSKMAEMLALKSQIMSDYKKNTAAASQQLLMGV